MLGVHEKREIKTMENWKRLATDMNHQRQVNLSMIDCGLERVVIWQEIKLEIETEITDLLNGMFLERDPVKEVLLGNAQNCLKNGILNVL